MYRSNPTGFMSHAYKRLVSLAGWPTNGSSHSYIDGLELKPILSDVEGLILNPTSQIGTILFKTIFCDKKVCLEEKEFDDEDCPLLLDCMMEHHKQMNSGINNLSIYPMSQLLSKPVGPTKKTHTKQIIKPSPTFFCKPESEEEIRQILSE
jgi:hypothetical protein